MFELIFLFFAVYVMHINVKLYINISIHMSGNNFTFNQTYLTESFIKLFECNIEKKAENICAN